MMKYLVYVCVCLGIITSLLLLTFLIRWRPKIWNKDFYPTTINWWNLKKFFVYLTLLRFCFFSETFIKQIKLRKDKLLLKHYEKTKSFTQSRFLKILFVIWLDFMLLYLLYALPQIAKPKRLKFTFNTSTIDAS